MTHSRLEQSLAGLQVGMFGGAGLLAVMILIPVLDHQPWWSFPDLLSSLFYGVRSINGGVGWPTLSGIAFQLLVAGAAGALFGLAFGRFAANRRISLLGVAWGVCLFVASEQFYRLASPVLAAYLPRGAAVVAHMVYGICLAGIGRVSGEETHRDRRSGSPGVAGPPVAVSLPETRPRIGEPDGADTEVAAGEVEIRNAPFDEPARNDVDSAC
jgi:hypothetical protein